MYMNNQRKVDDVPYIKNKKELSKYLKPLYIIENYMSTSDDYMEFQEKIYTIVKGCFEHKECREYPVKFKFYMNDTKVHTIQLRHFVINIFSWYPFIALNGLPSVLDDSFIIDCFNDIPRYSDYINKKVIYTLKEYNIRNVVINRSISEVLHNMRRISIDFSLILNLNITMNTFTSMYKENERLREIMDVELDISKQPHEIEELMNNLMNEEVEIIKGIENNPLGVILRTGTGIKHKQLAEYTIAMSMKPDLEGVTIPIPISSSTIINGLSKPSYQYIDALGARKSLITNKKVMGSAGYFGKLVVLLVRTLSLSKTVDNCDTKHLLPITIKNDKMLKKYNSRYYKINTKDDLSILDSSKDKHLIGQTILLRSPITCACENDEVCHKCFGVTSLLSADISDGVSAYEAEEITKKVNQDVLSIKHLLTTVSEQIVFNKDFYKFFNIVAGGIHPLLDTTEIDDLDNWAIWINPSDLKKSDEMDSDSFFNTYIEGKFYVENMITKEVIEIKSEDNREMFLTEECLTLMKKNRGYIKFKDMDDDTVLFELIIVNNELTRPLYELMDLLNKSRKKGETITYQDMAQKMTELLVDSGIDAMSVAGELIINRLIRKDPDETFERPDFSKEDIGDYQIYTLLKALRNNKSPLIGLASQDIKLQLLSDDITKKHGSSYIDPFYKQKTSTKRLKDIHKYLKTHKQDW